MHIFEVWNENQALKALCDGITWTACGYNNGREEERDLTAGPLCQEVLHDIFEFMPSQMTPASTEEGATAARLGRRPQGYQQWEASLKGERGDSPHGTPEWQQAVSALLPSAEDLELRYDE